jgi:hypothetical protein
MEKKLSVEQINHLFTPASIMWNGMIAIRLVDLANAIETQWQETRSLRPEALNTEFKKFGVFGFMDVVEKRQAVLSKSITVCCGNI